MGCDDLKSISVDFIPQGAQRYDTVGDYMEFLTHVHFAISRFSSQPLYSIAILIHEIVEKYLNQRDGIEDSVVDEWDMGEGRELIEPGLDPRAPYHHNHMLADRIEREFIRLAGLDWDEYERELGVDTGEDGIGEG